jgi:hypothetical protein
VRVAGALGSVLRAAQLATNANTKAPSTLPLFIPRACVGRVHFTDTRPIALHFTTIWRWS